MKKVSKNHVLPPNIQEKADKEIIRNIINVYDIEIATNLLYLAFKQIHFYENHITECINGIESEEKEKTDIND